MESGGYSKLLEHLTVSTCSELDYTSILDENNEVAYDSAISPKVILLGASSPSHTLENDLSIPQVLFIQCSLSTDEDEFVKGYSVCNEYNGEKTALKFSLQSVDFFFYPQQESEKNVKPTIKVLAVAREEDVEWRYLVQMRILTADAKSVVRVVDSDVFEFGNRTAPLIIDVNDRQISKIKLEMRFIHQMYNEMPKFNKGDLLLLFPKENITIKTYSALLKLHSPVIAHRLSYLLRKGDDPIQLEITECDSAAFCELLYQIYPTKRPIYANFRALCQAALAFSVKTVLDNLINHLVNYEHLSFDDKIREAHKLRLYEAITELVYNALKSGLWSYAINQGFNPKAEFSNEIYFKHVSPAVILAEETPGNMPYVRSVIPIYNFTDPLALNSSIACVKVQGKAFYVNRGVLAIYNDTVFGHGDNDEYFPVISVELRNELEHCELQLSDIMEPLFFHLYGRPNSLRSEFIRPLIVFAADHKMPYLLENLEEMLTQEPPITPETLFDHLKFADKYKLKNLLRTTLFRMEGSYKDAALKLVKTPQFEQLLSEEVRLLVTDRLCSGWSSWGIDWLRKCHPTVFYKRSVTATTGGPFMHDESDLGTLNVADSDYAFGVLGDNEMMMVKSES